MLVINCTVINNSIIFLDPVSLSVFKQVYFSLSDHKMSINVAKAVIKITPFLVSLQAKK